MAAPKRPQKESVQAGCARQQVKGPWGGTSHPCPHQEMTEVGLTSLVFWQAQPTWQGSSEWEHLSGPQPRRALQQGAEASTLPAAGGAISLSPGGGKGHPPCPSALLRGLPAETGHALGSQG